MNYHQQWLQYGHDIFCNIFNKIPQNIPKIVVPIVCGLPILYYATKKWRFQVTIEDNYQRIINEKNNTTQSVIDCIAFYDSESIKTIDYEIMRSKLAKFNENYNKLSANKITDVNLFNTKKDFLDCKQYHYKLWLDIDNKKLYGKLNHELIGGSNIGKFCYTAFAEEQKDNFFHSQFYHIFPAIKLFFNRKSIPRIQNPFPLYENNANIQRYMIRESFERKKNVKATMLYHIMQRLYYCLGIKSQGRDLVCYLPIAFYNIKNINNNIGIMWLTFNDTDTIETIKRKMEKNAYQIFATNFLLSHGFLNKNSSSKSIRHNVDAVITILFTEDSKDNSLISQGEIKNCSHCNFAKQNSKDNSLISPCEIKNCSHCNFAKQNYKDPNNIQISWTYPSIADYPVYVAVHSRLVDNTVHLIQTYTVNTPNFEQDNLKQVEHNYLFENS